MSEQESKSAKISRFAASKLDWLRRMPENAYRAQLANLRRGAGKRPGDLPELWGTILEGMPEEFQGRDGKPSREEWAIYITLTTFAVHQQGSSQSEWMSSERPFGSAVRELAPSDDDLERVLRRFNAFVTADNWEESAYYLRGLAQLLRSKEISFDYPALAADLALHYFKFPEYASKVRLKWGQDFYYIKKKETEDK